MIMFAVMVWDDIRILKIIQNSHLKGSRSAHTHTHKQEGVGPSGNTDRKLPTISDYLNMPKSAFNWTHTHLNNASVNIQ